MCEAGHLRVCATGVVGLLLVQEPALSLTAMLLSDAGIILSTIHCVSQILLHGVPPLAPQRTTACILYTCITSKP